MKRTIQHEAELPGAADELLAAFPDARVFAFHGEMGAGKTTFIKAICRQLGVKDSMSSPTFSLVNEYLTEIGETIYHFDFYRLKSEEEAVQAGLAEQLDSGNYCFVEWPEKVPSILPESKVDVTISGEGNSRTILAST